VLAVVVHEPVVSDVATGLRATPPIAVLVDIAERDTFRGTAIDKVYTAIRIAVAARQSRKAVIVRAR